MAEECGISIETLAQYFNTIEDPRCSGKVELRLTEVPVIACAESWDGIALYGREPSLRGSRRSWRCRTAFHPTTPFGACSC